MPAWKSESQILPVYPSPAGLIQINSNHGIVIAFLTKIVLDLTPASRYIARRVDGYKYLIYVHFFPAQPRGSTPVFFL